MLVAAELHRSTGEARWLELWQESAAWLEDECDPETGLWTQQIRGKAARYLGPAHGFAGCMLSLASFEATADFHERAAAVTRRLAVEEDGMANWPPADDDELQAPDGRIRVQWCHGAPGIVASLAGLAPDDDEHERLLRAGGELTWRAGPLAGKSRPLSRHRRQRLRVSRPARANRRRALARARPGVRDARGRAGLTRPRSPRPRPLHAVDRRSGGRALPGRLPRRPRRAAAALARPAREQVQEERPERRRDAEEPDRRQLDRAELVLRRRSDPCRRRRFGGEEAASQPCHLRRRDEYELWADRPWECRRRCECHVHAERFSPTHERAGIPLSGDKTIGGFTAAAADMRGCGSLTPGRKTDPIEVVMARAAGRTSIGRGHFNRLCG